MFPQVIMKRGMPFKVKTSTAEQPELGGLDFQSHGFIPGIRSKLGVSRRYMIIISTENHQTKIFIRAEVAKTAVQ